MQRPDNRRLLIAGAAGNLAIVMVWVVSRIVGLPFGPHPYQPESIGWKDLLASYDEFAVVFLILLVLQGRRVPTWALAPVWIVAGASFLAAFIAGGH